MQEVQAVKWVASAVLVILGAGAFWDGLYAPSKQLIAVGLAAVLALAVRGRARFSRLEAAALLLLTVGVAGSLAAPASAGVAAHGPVIVAGWILAMVAGRRLAERSDMKVELWLARFWAVIGTLMAFGGMVAISFTPVHHSGRLAAFLGYPVAVGMLGLLGLVGSIPDLLAGRRWASVLVLGNGLAILLSGSRWVWVTGVLLALYLLWVSPKMVWRAVRAAAPALGVALAASLWAAPSVANRESAPLLSISVLALLTLLLLQRFQGRYLWGAALLAWGAALALAPGWSWFLGRATALPMTEGSSVERLAFLQDGLALVEQLPLGAGYRGWSFLHLQAASYSYYSAEVHSAPLDMAIAFGWAGGLGFLLLLLRFWLQLRHSRAWSPERLAVLAGLGALTLHAALDWDLSYGLFAFPLWFGFGLAAPVGGETDRFRRFTWPAGLTVALAGLALAAAVLVGAGNLFVDQAEASLRSNSPESARVQAGMAVAVNPWNDLGHAYRGVAATRLGLSEEAVASFEQARELGPREPWYAQLLALELAQQGRWEESAESWITSVKLRPWYIPGYELALKGHIDLVQRARGAGNEPLAAELARSGEAILALLAEQKAREPAGTPRKPMQTDTPVIQQAEELFRQTLSR